MDSASKIPTESYRDILGWQHIKPEIEWDYIRMGILGDLIHGAAVEYLGGNGQDLSDSTVIDNYEMRIHEVLLVLESKKMMVAKELARVHIIRSGRLDAQYEAGYSI